MTEYRSEANDRRNRTILQAIFSKEFPRDRIGDVQRHQLSKAAEERALTSELGRELLEAAQQIVQVRDPANRRIKALNELDWRAQHNASHVIREGLLGVKHEIELCSCNDVVDEFLHKTLIGTKKPYGQYPTKPDAEDVGEPGAEDETDSYKYPGKPRIITKRDSYPPVGDNAGIEDLINTIRDFLSNHPQLTLDDIYRSAKVAI